MLYSHSRFVRVTLMTNSDCFVDQLKWLMNFKPVFVAHLPGVNRCSITREGDSSRRMRYATQLVICVFFSFSLIGIQMNNLELLWKSVAWLLQTLLLTVSLRCLSCDLVISRWGVWLCSCSVMWEEAVLPLPAWVQCFLWIISGFFCFK